MGLFEDQLVVLTDDNPKPEANGRPLHFNRDHIVCFYRLEADPTKTNVFTSDGRGYTVQESVEAIYKLVN